MTDESPPETSADQDAWVDIARAIRGQVAKQAELIPAMKIDELKTFLDAATSAIWLEHQARSLDRRVEAECEKRIWDN